MRRNKKYTTIRKFDIKETSMLALTNACVLLLAIFLMFLNAFYYSNFSYFELMFGLGTFTVKPSATLIILFIITLVLIVLNLLYKTKFTSKYYLLSISTASVILSIFYFVSPQLATLEGCISASRYYGHSFASTIFASFILLAALVSLGYSIYLIVTKKDN